IAMDIIKELNRFTYGPADHNQEIPLEKKEEEDEDSKKILYIICREHIQTKKDSPLYHRLFVKAFNFLARNAPDIANTYHISTDNLIDMSVTFIVQLILII